MKAVNETERQNRPITVPIKRVKDLNETDKKKIIFNALTSQGFKQSEVATIVNCDRAHINRIAKQERTGLFAPLANIARRRVKDVLTGKAIPNTERSKTSDVLKAVELVRDEVQPKINKQEIKSLHASFEVTTEDKERLLHLIGISQPQPKQLAHTLTHTSET